MSALRKGSIWEFFHSTIIGDGSLVGQYELTSTPADDKRAGAGHDTVLHLTNLETGGVAKVYSRALREGPKRAPHAHWRLAD